jgi:hypothetical protein
MGMSGACSKKGHSVSRVIIMVAASNSDISRAAAATQVHLDSAGSKARSQASQGKDGQRRA